MKKGLIFDIQKFCTGDGPGIRTSVFFKGCPLRCIWCHNPESKKSSVEIFYDAKKCITCRKCAHVCPTGAHLFDSEKHSFLRDKCDVCTLCVQNCPTQALTAVGELKSVEEVLREVLSDKIFYETSNGGVTLSGGEPMYQFDFALELLKACKRENLHTAMETCGFAPSEQYREIAPFTDLFLFDYKISDKEKHKYYVGADNSLILKNLYLLDSLDAKIILRCPIIPGINDTEEHFESIASVANSLQNILEINIEPYHSMGAGKAEKLGAAWEVIASSPDSKTVIEWIDFIKTKTDVPVIKA